MVLLFYYGTMNCGKSAELLRLAHNYEERNMKVLLLTPVMDGRDFIKSRTGLENKAVAIEPTTNIYTLVTNKYIPDLQAIFVDEAQFLTEQQVWNLADFASHFKLRVYCFGLRSDFQGKLFTGSSALMAIADELICMKSVCFCGQYATMTARIDSDGNIVRSGPIVKIGGNETYVAYCRSHWSKSFS
jgi:thymidine kinase